MTVALSAPKSADAPAIVLDTTQYYNLTQPMGNYIPFSVENSRNISQSDSSVHTSAGPFDLANTFHLASGVGSMCLLKSPYNSSFDYDVRSVNISLEALRLLRRYYIPDCNSVFVEGMHLDHFVPQVPITMKGLKTHNSSKGMLILKGTCRLI